MRRPDVPPRRRSDVPPKKGSDSSTGRYIEMFKKKAISRITFQGELGTLAIQSDAESSLALYAVVFVHRQANVIVYN